jgi:2,4-dienoyl-CoA reductase-like NADH-dependent reductase (Old Yellow Enzyme family)
MPLTCGVVPLGQLHLNPSYEVKRLLEMTDGWPVEPPLPRSVPVRRQQRTARQLSEREVDELVTAYADGASLAELSERLGIVSDA